jgi:muramoyltetrapeptide carboxypeptidase LdcA involved in peptidoglycan recycling
MPKNIDEQVDKLEAAVDPNTVISVGGINFTPAKLMIAGTIISTILGGLYGAFEVYKDYMSMKEAIQTYVTPDMSEINKKIAVLEQNSEKSTEYVRDINTNLKQDIRRLEGVVEGVERSSKQTQRETMQDVKEVRNELRDVRKEVDAKIKNALDNPLAN